MYFVIAIVLMTVLSIYRYTTGKLPLYDRINTLSDRSLFAFVIVISLGLSAIHIHSGHDWGGDYAEYISQALSILSCSMQEQVDVTSYMMINSHVQHGPGAYPWGYPLLILPIVALFGVNFVAIKFLNAVFYILLIFALWSFSKRFLDKYYRVLLCGIMTLNISFQNFLDEIYPDIVFCLFTVLSLIFIEKLYYEECNIKNSILVGIVSFFAYFVRSNGIISIITLATLDILYVFICVVIKHREVLIQAGIKKQNLGNHVTAYMTFFAIFVLNKMVFPMGEVGYSGYIDDISIKSILNNIIYYIQIMPSFWQTGRLFSIFLSCFMLILGICIMILSVRKYVHILVFCIEMGALLIVFPGVSQGIRYLYPILVLLLIAMLDAVQSADKSRNGIIANMGMIVLTAFSLLLVANMKYAYEEIQYPEYHYSNYSQNEMCKEMYEYIRLNTEKECVIISPKPRVIYLCTGRKGYSLGESNCDRISDADYILVKANEYGEWYNSYVLQQGYEIIYSNKQLILYEVR